MDNAHQAAARSQLRLLFEAGTVTGVSDGQLLEMYVSGRDELAFTAIVERHGPMVLRVCHEVLRDHHEAQDAFQATFLVLARCAANIQRRDSLASWLYGVALRVSAGTRSAAARRRQRERTWATLRAADRGNPPERIDDTDARFHQEIGRLPERFRGPVVLCYLEGRTYEEAAQVLRCPVGTVKSRLATARVRLRRRLQQRDPAILAGSAGLALRGELPTTRVPIPLPASTLKTVVRRANGGAAPSSISVLTQGVLQTMLWHRIIFRLAAAPLILACSAVVATAAIALARNQPDQRAADNQAPAAPAPATAETQGGPARSAIRPAAIPVASPNLPPNADDPLPSGALLRFGSARYRHPTRIESLGVSHDAKLAVAASGNNYLGAIRAYDLMTGHGFPDVSFNHMEGCVALSPDVRTVAVTAGSSPLVCLFDRANGTELARISYPAGEPKVLSDVVLFTPDGTHVVVKAIDGESLHLISVAEHKVVRTFTKPGHVFAAALSRDGKSLVAGGYDRKNDGWFANQWNVATGQELARIPTGGGIRAFAYSPDGATVAVGGERFPSASVRLVDAGTGKEQRVIPFPDTTIIRSLAYSPDGKTLAAAGSSAIRLLDPATGDTRLKIDRNAIALSFAPDGAALVGAVCNAIDRWDTATGRSLIPDGGDSSVNQIAATPDGQWVVTRGHVGDGHLWDAKTGAHKHRIPFSFQRGFALSPDGKYLVWAVPDESIKFKAPDEPSATYTGSRLRMIELVPGTPIDRFAGFAGTAEGVSFTDGGKTLVTVDYFRRDAGIRVWDVATGRLERLITADGPDPVWRSRLSPDGKLIAITYLERPVSKLVANKTVNVYEIATGSEFPNAPGGWIDDDATWQALADIGVSREGVTTLAFGPDGRLYSGYLDGTVLAWDVRARPHKNRE